MEVTVDLDYYPLIAGLLGGLALFLFGMDQLAGGLKALAGESMKTLLARLTTNRFMGMVTGAFVTAVIQSSSVTTVVVVGFISAGAMSLSQAIGVIIGANIGSTFTAQVIAFKVTELALPMIAVAFAMMFFARRDGVKQSGTMLMGLGMVFFGMAVMSDAMSPLRTYEPFMVLMSHMGNVALAVAIGALFTALVQSSAATMGIVMVLASQGLIGLYEAIAISLGANIGTCVTAALASIGRPREAVRASLAHILFNVGGVLVWLGFIEQLATAVDWLLVKDGEGLSLARQIATAHTLFNVANAALFIGLTTPMAWLLTRAVPDRPERRGATIEPKYLDPALVGTPSLALNAVRMEIVELGQKVQRMLSAILPAMLEGRRSSLEGVAAMDMDVDLIHRKLIDYLRKVGAQSITEREGHDLVMLADAANHLENIGDIVETDLVRIGLSRLESGVPTSEHAAKRIGRVHHLAEDALSLAIKAMGENDIEAARKVIAMKNEIDRTVEEATGLSLQRLIGPESHSLEGYTRVVEATERLKRIYYFAKRIAKTVVAADEAAKLEAAAKG